MSTQPPPETLPDNDAHDLANLDTKIKIEKTRAEIEKLRLETRYFRRNQVLEAVKAAGAIGALLGILLTFQSQRDQSARTELDRKSSAERADQERRFNAVSDLMRRFGDDKSSQTRLTAASALTQYLADPVYKSQVRTLFLSSIPLERESAVRDFVAQTMVGEASRDGDATLAALAAQNRDFQERIAALLQVPRLTVLQSVISLGDSVKDQTTAAKFQDAAADLEWNVSTLLRVLAKAHKAKDVDLSGITLCSVTRLADPSQAQREKSDQLISTHDRRLPDDGLVFDGVNLSGANLSGISFRNATFKDTRMDGAVLFLTLFWDCHFGGQTSLRDFSAALHPYILPGNPPYPAGSRRSYAVPPGWFRSDIDVNAFNPERPPSEPIFIHELVDGEDYVWFVFHQSTWNIKEEPPGWMRSKWKSQSVERSDWAPQLR